MKHVTIKDIARELKISVSSVSRAFNDKHDIKKETRELVLKKAEEMGYIPNTIARKLLRRKSFYIGVVVPDFVNRFFPEVLVGIQDVFLKVGYQVFIMQSNELQQNEIENVKALVENMVDGLLVAICTQTKDFSYYQNLLKKKFPMVFFNRTQDELSASSVTFNDYQWAFLATEHLIRQGCNRPVHLAAPYDTPIARNRKQGFIDALSKHHIPTPEELVVNADYHAEDGEERIENLISSNFEFDGVFAVNDLCAIGAMKALKRNGLAIPEDVAVIGFTKTLLSKYVEPQLSTIEQPTYEMGKTAAELLLKQINADEDQIPKPEKIVLSGQLISRASSVRKN